MACKYISLNGYILASWNQKELALIYLILMLSVFTLSEAFYQYKFQTLHLKNYFQLINNNRVIKEN